MKAQKINEDSKRVQVGKTQKGTGEKPSQIGDGTRFLLLARGDKEPARCVQNSVNLFSFHHLLWFFARVKIGMLMKLLFSSSTRCFEQARHCRPEDQLLLKVSAVDPAKGNW